MKLNKKVNVYSTVILSLTIEKNSQCGMEVIGQVNITEFVVFTAFLVENQMEITSFRSDTKF